MVDAVEERSDNLQAERFNTANLYLSIWKARKEIGIASIISIAAALVWIAVAQPLYMATTVIAPTPSSLNSTSPLSSLASAAKLAGIPGLSPESNNEFIEFRALLTSRALAEALARQPGVLQTVFYERWDDKTHSWKHSIGLLAAFKAGLRTLFNMGPPVDPNAEQLEFFLEKNLSEDYVEQTGLLTLNFEFRDPIFARDFLASVHRDADNILRNDARKRSQARIAYLEKMLPTVTAVEQRQALIELLSEEEQTNMMVASDPNYAADLVDPPSVSMRPVWPNAPLMLGISVVAAVFVGVFWHHVVGRLSLFRLRTRLVKEWRNGKKRYIPAK